MNTEEIQDRIVNKYLTSNDFNGYPLRDFEDHKNEIIELINEDRIEINFGDVHPNPYIKALELDNKEVQVEKINKKGLNNACAYPTKTLLSTIIDLNYLKDKPFTRKLALGEPQLGFSAFDMSILEIYRNDPRYSFFTDEISGQINISDDYIFRGIFN